MAEPAAPAAPAAPASPASEAPANPVPTIDPAAPVAAPADLEFDAAEAADADSAYAGSTRESETSTLSSSILNYRKENGRTYHSYGSTEHWGPNDEAAKDQQDLSHHFWTLLLEGQLYLAPIKPPKKVLDLGTGTGIWAIDMADEYPTATITGTDLSPIQPSWIPPNCQFEIDDYNKDYGRENSYDLVHTRELLGSVPNWVEFFKKAYAALEPGGWIDCTEPAIRILSTHHAIPATHPWALWYSIFTAVDAKSGLAFDIAPGLKSAMQEAGFVNIVEKKTNVPIGKWPKDKRQKELGAWNQLRIDTGLRDFAERRLKTVMNWENDEILVLVAKCRAAVQDPREGLCHDIYHVYGQKPVKVEAPRPDPVSEPAPA